MTDPYKPIGQQPLEVVKEHVQPVVLTREELRQVVKESVHETLTTIGVDPSNPIEMQKDFQHLREWRESMKTIKNRSMLTIVGVVTTGIIAALWIGFKDFLEPR